MKIPKKIVPHNENTSPDDTLDTSEDIYLDLKKEIPTLEKKEHKQLSGLDLFNELNEWLLSKETISLRDKLSFFQLLSATHNAGIALPESLAMIGSQTKHRHFKQVILNLKELVEDGASLAEAMSRNDDVFDKTVYTIVEAGEKSGKLHDVLSQLVEQYERIDLIKKKVIGLFIYPAVVIFFMIAAAIVVILFIVPTLEGLFKGQENLPMLTQILIKLSDIFRQQWYIILLLLGGLIGGFFYWKGTRSGGQTWTRFVLSIPIVSDIYRGMILSRFSRIFGFLINAGVPIIDVMRLTAQSTNNPLYEEKILLAADDLARGISIAENISDNEKMFPNIFVKMLSIGEKSAATSEIMVKIAFYYEEIVERTIRRLSSIMEPLFLIFIAGAVLLMILAIYFPILEINDVVLKNA